MNMIHRTSLSGILNLLDVDGKSEDHTDVRPWLKKYIFYNMVTRHDILWIPLLKSYMVDTSPKGVNKRKINISQQH